MDEPTPYQLLLKRLQGTLSPDEQAQLLAWANRSPENRRIFEQTHIAWQAAPDPAAETGFATEQEWQELAGRLDLNTTAPVQNDSTGKTATFLVRQWMWRAAAAVALLIAAWWVVSRIAFRETPLITQHTEAGAKGRYTLPDGTIVWLNAQSKISYPEVFSGASREVSLSGEAFFEVQRDTQRPFVIRAGNTVTRVLGTSFNLHAPSDGKGVTVTVVTGKVGFSPEGKPAGQVLLTAGMRGSYLPEADSVYSEPQQDPNVLAWQSNKLVFKNTPLREMIGILQKQYHTSIEVATPGILNCLFTSTFEDTPLTEVLEAVSLALDLRYVYQEGKYVLSGEGCQTSFQP